ncbi:MAG: hypothetical protein IKS45_01435, partial [Thermoguttaceae bacterium]|nr:hypothetical protein [Thermoguttaceae bacterium]
SRLSGHVSHKGVPGVEFSTGSLGHGLAVAAGLAMGARLDGASWHTFCILGDGECDEGSVWEAALQAHHFGLDHLIAVVDHNHMQSLDDCEKTLRGQILLSSYRKTTSIWRIFCSIWIVLTPRKNVCSSRWNTTPTTLKPGSIWAVYSS